MKLVNVISFATAFFSLTNASALNPCKPQDVFIPIITSPTAQTVWTVGTTATVTWSTANAPKQITNRKGQVMLAKGGTATPVVLAAGFDILTGYVSFVVPDVINGLIMKYSEYPLKAMFLVFGDSGDFSEAFTITGSDSFF